MSRWGRTLISLPGGAERTDSGHPVVGLLSVSRERIEEIVAAAERAGLDIDAAVARSVSGGGDSASLIAAELGQALVERARALRSEAQVLAAILSRAGGQLEALIGDQAMTAPPAMDVVPPKLPFAVVPAPAPNTNPDENSLRLLATQMAIAGATSESIEERLRTEFNVGDPSAIAAATFAPAGMAHG